MNWFGKLFLLASIVFCAAILWAVIGPFLSLNVSQYNGDWTETEYGYVSSEKVSESGRVCICPAYECETSFEATMIATDGFFLRQFRHVQDPIDQSYNRRSVYGVAACVEKQKGETLQYSLTEFKSTKSLYLTLN